MPADTSSATRRGRGMSRSLINLEIVNQLTGGRLGVFDTRCPLCSASRKPANQRKQVFRIWRDDRDFATYHCVHCLAHGHIHEGYAARPDPVALERAKREAAERHRIAATERLRKARWLWSQRRPLTGSIGEAYLRDARGYNGPLPATLGFLPSDDKRHCDRGRFGDRPRHRTRLCPRGCQRRRT
jgi:hypothetical protein